ncbi:MAG: NAD(P)/FAD-dependent oxidoreductase [Pseudomonadota bacterium]
MEQHDVIVAGEGIAGLAAALACARAGLSVLSLEPELYGGLVASVNELVDAGTDLEGADLEGSGIDVATLLASEAMDAGVVRLPEAAVSLRSLREGWEVATPEAVHAARCVIVATGAARRRLPIAGLDRFEGRGLSWCADCDAPLLGGREVAVVGGGDSALQEAMVLARHASRVHLVLRGREPRARARLRALFDRARIDSPDRYALHPEHQVVGIEGAQTLQAIVLQGSDGTRRMLAVDAVFPCIGLEPRSGWAGLPTDNAGAILTDASGATTRAGVFAVGAVRSGYGGRLGDAIADAQRVAAAVVAHGRAVA